MVFHNVERNGSDYTHSQFVNIADFVLTVSSCPTLIQASHQPNSVRPIQARRSVSRDGPYLLAVVLRPVG
jgi:hypothetical protein